MSIPCININTINGTIQVAETINNYNGQPTTTKTAQVEEAEVVEEQVPAKVTTKPHGRPRTVLFPDSNGKENTIAREQEKQHVLNYLKQHNLSATHLSAEKNNPINRMTAAFVRYWKEKGLVPDKVSHTAVYHFLTNDCGIPNNNAQGNTIANKWRDYFKDSRYGREEYYNLKDTL